MTHLRKLMLEELQRRNYSPTTVNAYLKTVETFAKHFHRSPDQLGPDQIRSYQVYVLKEKKLGVRTVAHRTAALRFFFVKTLKRREDTRSKRCRIRRLRDACRPSSARRRSD